jgi:hypothetical protein
LRYLTPGGVDYLSQWAADGEEHAARELRLYPLIQRATVRDATWVAAHMRDQDWAEISATGLVQTRTQAGAWLVAHSPEHAYTAFLRGQAVAVFGVTKLIDPHYWSGWAYGTDRMVRAVPAITRFCLDTIKPDLLARGCRRVEVKSAVQHDLSHRWLTKMGAQPEGVALDVGRNGEAFVTYSWAKSRL